MLDYEIRHAHAKAYYQTGLERVANTPEPEGQKFPIGSRVKIFCDGGQKNKPGVGEFATVEYVYAHAYGGDDVKKYALNIDGNRWSWYDESQLERVSE
jgi:hypothetical protein